MVNLAALPPRLIVTGASGSGKTAYCRQVVAAAEFAGWRIAGLLSLARFNDGQKTGIFALDLASGTTRLLASCAPGEINGMRFGKWMFDRDVLAWGNRLLLDLPACGLVIVDEIGPLELERQQGWSACLQALAQPRAAITLATVRPACLPQLQALWTHSVTLRVGT